MQPKKNGRNIDIQKPRVSDVYTANMGGVDRTDHFQSYYTVGRQSRKWYRYIFWFLFNVAVCNGYVLECEHWRRNRQWKQPRAAFRLELGKRLINNYSYRKRLAHQVPVQEPRQDHQSVWMEGRKKECVQCKSDGRKPRKAIQWRRKISAYSVVLHYVKCGASSSITVKMLEHCNSFYNLLFLIYWLSKTCEDTTETE